MKFPPSLYLVVYAYVKDMIPFIELSNILAGVLSMLLIMITMIILTPFMVAKFCAFIVLKLMYGGLFGGFLTGIDVLFEDNNSNSVINIILIYSSLIDKPEAQTAMLRKLVDQIYNSSYKFSCTIEKLFGFLYFKKNQVKPEEILEIVNRKDGSCLTRNNLYDYIEQNCDTINGNRTWRAIGFTQPISWNEDGGNEKQYVAVLTIRHSVGDALGLMGTLKNIFDQNNEREHILTREIVNRRPKIDFRNTYIRTNILPVVRDRQLLRIGNKWNLVTYVEPNPRYLSLIKTIKKRLNVTFIDVIGAAVSASVKDYVTRTRKLEMDTFTMATIVRVYEREEREIINKTYNFKELINTSGFEMYDISFGANERSMKEKIRFMHPISKSLRNSLDFLVLHVIPRDIFAYIPVHITSFLRDTFIKRITVGITNLVGFDKSSYCNFSIDEIYFCVPNFISIGFLFCIFSYDGRIGISLLSTRGYVHNREELQTILENTFKYIDEAGREILD